MSEKLLTLSVILDEVKARGLSLALADGTPRLRGDPAMITSTLLGVLKRRRDEVIALLREEQGLPPAPGGAEATPAPAPSPAPVVLPSPREWLWYSGHRHIEGPDDPWLFGHADRHPVGAWFWRCVGEGNWRPVPGRGGAAFVTPAGSLDGGPSDER